MLIYTGYERKPFRAVVEEEGERERERKEGRREGEKKRRREKTEKRKGEKRRLSRCINANISHRFA